MKLSQLILGSLAASFALWQSATFASTNLIANPSFESGVSAWVFSGGGAGTCFSPCTAPHTGSAAAYKNLFDGGMGTISQSLATIPGLTYAVGLWLADNNFAAGTVTASFGSVLGVTATAADTSTAYRQYTFTAVAVAPMTDFVFAGTVTSGTFFLDDVSVSPIPEPGQVVLLLAGLLPLILISTRRRAH